MAEQTGLFIPDPWLSPTAGGGIPAAPSQVRRARGGQPATKSGGESERGREKGDSAGQGQVW